ncbi:MAG: hypothetical protein ACYDAO_04175 [Thermoplasmataceae archaeon]
METIAIIVPTMMRNTLLRATQSIDNQVNLDGINVITLVRHDPDVNEYVSRIRAIKDLKRDLTKIDVIGFLDDDAYYLPNTIANAMKYFRQGYKFVQGVAMVMGHPFKLPKTGVGTATFVTPDVFDKITFRFDIAGKEPRSTKGLGWRMDTMFLYDFFKEYGEDKYILAEDVVIAHPENMKGIFNPDIELKFYNEYKEYVEKYVLPIDPRLQHYINKWSDEGSITAWSDEGSITAP